MGEFAGIGLGNQLLHIGNIRQHSADNIPSHGHGIPLQNGRNIQLRQLTRHKQSAIRSKAGQNRLGAIHLMQLTAGRMILHKFLL